MKYAKSLVLLVLAAIVLVSAMYIDSPAAHAAVPVTGNRTSTAGVGGVTAHLFVKLSDANTIATASASSDSIVGICEETAVQGAITQYAGPGMITTVTSGASAINVGDILTSDASGCGTPVPGAATTAMRGGAVALTASSTSGTSVTVVVCPTILGTVTSFITDTTIGTNKHLYLRDTGQYVYSDAANSLTIAAGSRIKAALPIIQTNQTLTAVAGNISPAANASGNVYNVTADAVITLPSTVAGVTYTFIMDAPDGTVQISLAPAAIDQISGVGTTGVDNKAYINTKATAKRGDMVRIVGDGTNGWMIQVVVGTWAWAS